MQNTTTMFLSSFAHMATVGSCDQTVRSGRGFFAKSGVQGCPRHGGPGILPGGLILKDRMLGHLPLAISTPFRFALLGCGSLVLIRVRRENANFEHSTSNIEPKRRLCGHGSRRRLIRIDTHRVPPSTLIECRYMRAM